MAGKPDARPNEERELALSLGDVDEAAVIKHPLVDALAIDRPVSERLISTYYDTADGALMARGVVLRIRRSSKGLVQAIKAGGPKGAGLAARDEWETELDAPSPQWPVPLPAALKTRLKGVGRPDLRPLFATVFTRTKRRLATPGGDVVELAVDRGTVEAGERTERIAEVELELLSGNAGGLFDLALALLADLPLTLQTISKGERGFHLAAGRGQPAVMAEPVVLDPGMTAGDAFHTLLPAAAGHAVANTPAILDGADPMEGVHQMRVGLRRLRAALDIFGPDLRKRDLRTVKALLKPQLEVLGPIRDLDVFVEETLPPVAAAPGQGTAVQAFVRAAARSRMRVRDEARAMLRHPRHTQGWLTFGRWMASDPIDDATPVAKFAAKVLDKRAGVVRQAGKKIKQRPVEDLHALRIEIKRLRYAAEFFASLYEPDKAAGVIPALKKAQDALGRLNDLAVADAVIANILAEQGGSGAVARGAATVAERLRDGNRHRRARAEKAYLAFKALEPFWR